MKRFSCAFSLALGLLATRLFGAAPVYTDDFAAVTLDGVRLGTDLDASNLSLFPSVVYDPATAVFHMWVIAGATQSVEDIQHATSSDGVHFVSTGSLSFAGGNPFPANGAPVEPLFVFPRVAKLGSDWKLLLWTHNDPTPGVTGNYNYNESVNNIGTDIATLAVVHQGPVYPTNGTGTFGQTTGPFGMVGGKLYVADDRPGGISKWSYNDTTPPSVDTPPDHYQDLITGTGYVYFLTNPGDPLAVYVHNIGRVLDQGDGTLGVYYSLRHPDGSRVNKQIYYAESGDNGQSWSTPVGIFADGAAVLVDGAPNQFEFSHPEVTLAGARRVLYFSTKAADGQSVVATSAGQLPSPAPMSVDGHGTGTTSNLNGVLESGETVVVAPAWRNTTAAALALSGTAPTLTGPAGPGYSIADGSADYGTVSPGATADCYNATVAHDCYRMTVTGARPAAHWDATFDEAIFDGSLSLGPPKTWTLHVGQSFTDVPMSQQFYAFIENMFHNGITVGCGAGIYCPDSSVARDQMAAFLLRAEHGATYLPPGCKGIFDDVPCPGEFADFVEQLFNEGITSGCGVGLYCPKDPATREQMAVLLLRTKNTSAYVPPACTTQIFTDVPCSSGFAAWIGELAAEGITVGCGAGYYCPTAANTRGEMAVFIVRTFGLLLYGP